MEKRIFIYISTIFFILNFNMLIAVQYHNVIKENVFEYNVEDYNFIGLFQDLFQHDLNTIHEDLEEEYPLFDAFGKDSDTKFHKKFYDKIRADWPQFEEMYRAFIAEVILPFLGLEEALYQTYPSFRIQLPNNVAVGQPHYDADLQHPLGEINFIVALTPMFDTNAVWIESQPRHKDFHPMTLQEGQGICFNGNTCTHFNKINTTGVTRMSFDFRILPLDKYNQNYEGNTVTTGKKFIEGEYYLRIKSTN